MLVRLLPGVFFQSLILEVQPFAMIGRVSTWDEHLSVERVITTNQFNRSSIGYGWLLDSSFSEGSWPSTSETTFSSPPARWGLLDFMSVDFGRLPPPSASSAFSGPQPRPSTPSVPCRTSTTTIHAQCSLPDLNRENPRPVFPAGPQPPERMPKDMPDRMPERMSARMLDENAT